MTPGVRVNMDTAADLARPFPRTEESPRAGHPVYELDPSFGASQPSDGGAAWYQEGERLMRGHEKLREPHWEA
eukprot:11219546-Alexandrium_andersonii.AAC.1